MAMWLSGSRLIGTGLTVAAVAGVGALAYAAIGGARNLPRLAAERGQMVTAAEAGPAEHDKLAQARDDKGPPAATKDTLPQPRITPPIARTPLSPPRKEEATPGKDPASAPKPETTPDAARANTTRESARGSRDVRVTAPNTDVDVDKERGNVRVRAPHTKVDVDPDRGQVRVRAPYVNLDIRW
jgi:hypothetical protein